MYTTYSIDNAPDKSKKLLEAANSKFGFVPNLLATMAESPALLEGYMTLSNIFSSSSLSATEQQIILLTASYENECGYCMAAHTVASQKAKIPEDVINAIREGNAIEDQKLEALHQFAKQVVVTRGWLQEADVKNFLDAGYNKQNILEVILGVAVKVMSNYTNHVAKTSVDDVFAQASWKK